MSLPHKNNYFVQLLEKAQFYFFFCFCFYLIHNEVIVAFILEIKSTVNSNASNGGFVARYFLEMFHQEVKQVNNVISL